MLETEKLVLPPEWRTLSLTVQSTRDIQKNIATAKWAKLAVNLVFKCVTATVHPLTKQKRASDCRHKITVEIIFK